MRESFPDRLGFFLADLRQWNSHATVDEDLNPPAATLPRSPSLRAQWRAVAPYSGTSSRRMLRTQRPLVTLTGISALFGCASLQCSRMTTTSLWSAPSTSPSQNCRQTRQLCRSKNMSAILSSLARSGAALFVTFTQAHSEGRAPAAPLRFRGRG